MYNKLLFFTSIIFLCNSCDQNNLNKNHITVYGETVELSNVEKTIIKSDDFKRLCDVDQSGAPRYVYPETIPSFSRFDHSIGVWYLTKKFSKSKNEHYASLLHDISHAAFSHTIDYISHSNDVDQEHCVQDNMHTKFIKNSSIYRILNKKFGLSISDLDCDNPEYKCLEQNYPAMCADRIEYNIHTALLTKKITLEQAKSIINSLRFENNIWFFVDADIAKLFAELSLYFTKMLWSAEYDFFVNAHFAEAIKVALQKGLIKNSELYVTDTELTKNPSYGLRDSKIH